MTEQTTPNDKTVEADRADAHAEHGANEVLTPDQEEAAERNTVSPGVAGTYQEQAERGANHPGEGRI